ncbi:enhanced serine sensitivity protein SseB C-terminal domain-containing protein [Actinoplanes sp. NPDC023801]|uniref:enhanced serine sensitivity protein SseB C-terminal domain-containing protein n=1 Tax=Actinoplanes sp. NPDC023801 TaxID=3154595 RepID=UPI0033DE6F71
MFPANTLETTLLHVRRGESPPDALLTALADHPIWVPLPAGPESGGGQLPVTTIGGEPYVVVYTSAEQLAKAGASNRRQIRLTGRQLAERMPAELGFVVNPGSATAVPVAADRVRRLCATRPAAGSRILLGVPRPEPYHLLEALIGGFRASSGVIEARRALCSIDDGAGTLMIGVRPDRRVTTWQRDVRAAVDYAARVSPVPNEIEVLPLDEQSSVATWMLTRTQAFYHR